MDDIRVTGERGRPAHGSRGAAAAVLVEVAALLLHVHNKEALCGGSHAHEAGRRVCTCPRARVLAPTCALRKHASVPAGRSRSERSARCTKSVSSFRTDAHSRRPRGAHGDSRSSIGDSRSSIGDEDDDMNN
ncbi:unnamed protein product [Lampetra planeri]